jgi:DNA polymerase III alpha subunit
LTKQNKLIGIFRLEDLAGQMEAVAYGELLDSLPADVLTTQSLVLVKGKIKKTDEDITLVASAIRKLADASIVSIYFNKEQSFAELQQLKTILSGWKGDDPVMLNFPSGKNNQTILVGNQFWVKATNELKTAMDSILADKAKVMLNKVRV